MVNFKQKLTIFVKITQKIILSIILYIIDKENIMSNSEKLELQLKAQVEYTQLLEAIMEKAFGEEGFRSLMEELAQDAAKNNIEFPKKKRKYKERVKK